MISGLIMGLIISLSFNPFSVCDYGDDGGHVEFVDRQTVDKENQERFAGLPKQHTKHRNIALSLTSEDND